VFECSNERCLVLIVLAPYHGASAKLNSCSSCKVAPYCSKEGQADDLPYHQTKKPQKLKMNQEAAVNGCKGTLAEMTMGALQSRGMAWL